MTTIDTVSAQWASRPSDQRFLDLESLQYAVDARRQLSHTATLPLARFDVNGTDQNEVVLSGSGIQPTRFTNWSFGQFSSIAGAPASYLRKLPAPLAAANLEYGLRFGNGEADKDAKLLYLEGEDGVRYAELRAATSPSYGRIWDSQVVSAVRHINADGRWHVPPAFNKLDGFVVDNHNTTLYASDRDVFIFLVDERRPIVIDDQTYFRGFYTWNSEVGKATFGLATFLYSYVCCNRIIWGARDIEELRIRHTSLAPDRFIEQAAPALKALSEASTAPIEAAIRKAKEFKIADKVDGVAKWLKGKGFGQLETAVALRLAASGHEAGSSGDPTNLWDVVQGGTAAARAITHQDSRIEAEQRWSGLLREVSTN